MSPVRREIKDIEQSYTNLNKSREGNLPRSDLTHFEDKNAYMTFLEIQLERVSQACLEGKGTAEKVNQLTTKLNAQDEKIVNISRLVKLL